MKIERDITVTLSNKELCEAVTAWVNTHGECSDISVIDATVEFLSDDGEPFTYDITARATERT